MENDLIPNQFQLENSPEFMKDQNNPIATPNDLNTPNKDDATVSDLQLDFENEENSDIKQQFMRQNVDFDQDYNTQQLPHFHKIQSQKEDGLPTIFEKSTQHDPTNVTRDLNIIKSKTHIKRQSAVIDMQQFKTNQLGSTPKNRISEL